ncbi:hypothetical protein PV08_11938 [Exophiala spinifera]|uniref:Heterokaryon incompatibility domain-containing protein n=1 Tax=Exophiala spinifera TaxID=91928 RepID=A0A0D1Z9Y9_9EURO|nr:uncharacterized protein PV08_11938 [Exophiala spinifera]KIW09837.1 hypothetical protein PV08_11938 [Exophiala spinifera]
MAYSQRVAYRHKSLESPGEQIRLLTIAPGLESQSVQCSITHHRLAAAPEYEALSYMWGSKDNPVEISLKDDQEQGTFSVTQNLHQALCRLRYQDRERVMWVDAISINQGDNVEKSSQVPRMKKIFENAKRVIAWLGEAGEDSDRAIEWIEELAESLRNWERAGFNTNFVDSWITIKLLNILQQSDRDGTWTALWRLLSRDYWGRIWIIQEITFARELVLCCGRKYFLLPGLVKVLSELLLMRGHHHEHPRRWPEAFEKLFNGSNLLLMEGLRQTRTSPKSPQLFLFTLQSFCHSRSEKPHDQIYALLGFLEGSKRPYQGVIHVDYERTVEDVFTDVVEYCISAPRSIDNLLQQDPIASNDDDYILSSAVAMLTKRPHGPLSILCAAFPFGRDPGWPSWLPDWRRSASFATMGKVGDELFQASADHPAHYMFSPDRRVLHVFGYKVDNIKESSAYMSSCWTSFVERGKSKEDLGSMIKQVRQWAEFAVARTAAGGPGEDLRVFDAERFWRTLAFDSGRTAWDIQMPKSWRDMSLERLEDLLKHGTMVDDSPSLSRSSSFAPGPHRRSHPNLHHLSLAPLTPKYPIDPADYSAYFDPSTSELHTITSISQISSLPSPSGILTSHSAAHSRASSRTRQLRKKTRSAISVHDHPAAHPHHAHAHFAGALTSEGFGHKTTTVNASASRPGLPHLHTTDPSWLIQTGLALTEGSRESKGQSWIGKRDSSTSLHSPATPAEERDRDVTNSHHRLYPPSLSSRRSLSRAGRRNSRRSLAVTPALRTPLDEEAMPHWDDDVQTQAEIAAQVESEFADEFEDDPYGLLDFEGQFDSDDEEEVRREISRYRLGRWMDGVVDVFLRLEEFPDSSDTPRDHDVDLEAAGNAVKTELTDSKATTQPKDVDDTSAVSDASIEPPPDKPNGVWDDVVWFGRLLVRTVRS